MATASGALPSAPTLVVTMPPLPKVGSRTPPEGRQRSSSTSNRGRKDERCERVRFGRTDREENRNRISESPLQVRFSGHLLEGEAAAEPGEPGCVSGLRPARQDPRPPIIQRS